MTKPFHIVPMVDEGASLSEQLIGAARYNNDQLIEQLIEGKPDEEVAKIINTTSDPVGNGLLHICARHGSLEALDVLLDQEGVEIDPRNRLSENTPLHEAVEFAVTPGNEDAGIAVAELLIEAGAQPNPKNARGKKPIDLAASSTKLVNILRGAQYAAEMEREAAAGGPVDGVDVAVDDEEGEEGEVDDEIPEE